MKVTIGHQIECTNLCFHHNLPIKFSDSLRISLDLVVFNHDVMISHENYVVNVCCDIDSSSDQDNVFLRVCLYFTWDLLVEVKNYERERITFLNRECLELKNIVVLIDFRVIHGRFSTVRIP